jgi:hypothetical protein
MAVRTHIASCKGLVCSHEALGAAADLEGIPAAAGAPMSTRQHLQVRASKQHTAAHHHSLR